MRFENCPFKDGLLVWKVSAAAVWFFSFVVGEPDVTRRISWPRFVSVSREEIDCVKGLFFFFRERRPVRIVGTLGQTVIKKELCERKRLIKSKKRRRIIRCST